MLQVIVCSGLVSSTNLGIHKGKHQTAPEVPVPVPLSWEWGSAVSPSVGSGTVFTYLLPSCSPIGDTTHHTVGSSWLRTNIRGPTVPLTGPEWPFTLLFLKLWSHSYTVTECSLGTSAGKLGDQLLRPHQSVRQSFLTLVETLSKSVGHQFSLRVHSFKGKVAWLLYVNSREKKV